MYVGRMVVVTLRVTVSSALNNNTKIVSNMPASLIDDCPLHMSNVSSINAGARIYGGAIYASALSAGTWNISGSYIRPL